MKYGYARASTDGQDVDAQVAALCAAGACQTFRVAASRAKTNRSQLRRALGQLAASDVRTSTRLDPPARLTCNFLNTITTNTDRNAGFRALDDGWADITMPDSKRMLAAFGGPAEFQRELIRVRTTEGRRRGIARSIKLPHKSKLMPHRRDPRDPVRESARSYNVNYSTISKLTA